MPTIVDEAESIIKQALSNGHYVQDSLTVTETVAKKVLDVSAAEFSRGMDNAGALATENAAASMRSLMSFSGAMNAINVVFTLHQIKDWMKQGFSRMPKVIGKPLVRLTDLLILPEEKLLNSLLDSLGQHSHTALHAHVQLTGWALQQDPLYQELTAGTFLQPKPTYQQPYIGPSVDPTAGLQREIDQLKKQVAKLGYAIGVAQNHEGVPQPFVNQVHELQRVQHYQTNALLNLQGEMNAVRAKQDSVENRLNDLSHSLGNLRQVTTGWQDVVTEVGNLSTAVVALGVGTTAALQDHTRRIEHLSPLGLLLQPGISGLRTLRQLEDTPCMCPKIPNIPDAWGVALGLMEFVENG